MSITFLHVYVTVSALLVVAIPVVWGFVHAGSHSWSDHAEDSAGTLVILAVGGALLWPVIASITAVAWIGKKLVDLGGWIAGKSVGRAAALVVAGAPPYRRSLSCPHCGGAIQEPPVAR